MAIAGVGTRSTETRARKPRELSDLSATLTALKPKTVLLAQNGDIQGMEYLSAEQLAEIIVDKNSSLKRRDAACSQMEELGLDQVSEATLQRIMRQGQQRYSDWARNQLESKRFIAEVKRKSSLGSGIASQIIQDTNYSASKWATIDGGSVNVSFEDLRTVANQSYNRQNRDEAVRRMNVNNSRAMLIMRAAKKDNLALLDLLAMDDEEALFVVLKSGDEILPRAAARKLMQRGVKRENLPLILQYGEPTTKDKAAAQLISYGLSRLTITELRYLVNYARGQARISGAEELKTREITGDQEKRNIDSEISRCSSLPYDQFCFNLPMGAPAQPRSEVIAEKPKVQAPKPVNKNTLGKEKLLQLILSEAAGMRVKQLAWKELKEMGPTEDELSAIANQNVETISAEAREIVKSFRR